MAYRSTGTGRTANSEQGGIVSLCASLVVTWSWKKCHFWNKYLHWLNLGYWKILLFPFFWMHELRLLLLYSFPVSRWKLEFVWPHLPAIEQSSCQSSWTPLISLLNAQLHHIYFLFLFTGSSFTHIWIAGIAFTIQGYAYILTHPGIPTVFYDHFYDWGNSIHDQIVKLVRLLTYSTIWIGLSWAALRFSE